MAFSSKLDLEPSSEVVKGLVPLNKRGEIPVSCSDETTMPGLFAAGDVTDVAEKQILIAAGEGAKAVLTAHRYLQHLAIEAKPNGKRVKIPHLPVRLLMSIKYL